jgi:rhodanese-related sulfurtransferase
MMSLKNIKLIVVTVLICITLSSCAQNIAKKEVKDIDTKVAVQTQSIVELISPEDLNAKLGNIQLIDIRTPGEFAEGYLKGAKLINFFDKDFLDQMSKLDKNKELYIYCRSGNRSGQAAKKLETMGFTKIYDLKDGIKSWKKKNLEIIK